MICPCGYAHNTEHAEHCKQCGEPLEAIRLRMAEGTNDYARLKAEADARAGGHAPPAVAAGPVKRHVLLSFGAAPISIPIGRGFVFGRLPEADITIPSTRVSRKHTEIVWRSGFPVARNLSTSSSTLVNGKAIDEHELRSRDRIQVGPYECQYVMVKPGEPVPEFDENAGSDIGMTMIEDESTALSGRLEQMGLWGLLRTFEVQKKTGTLALRSHSKEGQIILDQGRFVSATRGEVTGKAAVFELLTWGEGEFDFSLEKKAAPRKLIRKFDYSDSAPKRDDLKRKTVTAILQEAEHQGIREPIPPELPTRPAPAPARPQRPQRPPGGRRPPPPGGRRPPPVGQRPPSRPPARPKPGGQLPPRPIKPRRKPPG